MSDLLLSLSDIALTFGGAPLFRRARLDIAAGARAALVGRNGAGKSTLLKIAAGVVEPDSGDRFVRRGAVVRYLPQEPDFAGFETAGDFLEHAAPGAQERRAAHRLADELDLSLETRLSAASEGEARRAALIAALAGEPDVLLLDEPTNHLDLASIAWLEDTLRARSAAIVVVSHDRRFLETLTAKTIWVDRGETKLLNRGFRAFEAWRDKLLEEESAALHKLGRKIAAEEDWLRYGVTARRRRNMRRLRELRAMRAKHRDTQRAHGAVAFSANAAPRASKRVIVAKDISKSFNGEKIVDGFSIEIARGEKIGVVGPNGAGKTTLVNMLIGALRPDAGSLTLADNVKLVSLDQRRARLKPQMRLADAISDGSGDWAIIGGAKRHVASYLQDFLFKPEQWRTPVAALSGGERGRLALAAALARPSNLLALDEPTNDLDLETLDLLQERLAEFDGALILVSHDRSFLDRLATSIIAPAPDQPQRWIRYAGGFDDMVAQRGAVPDAKPSAFMAKLPSKARASSPARQKKQTKLSYKEQYALEQLPQKIAELTARIAAVKQALSDPTLFERDAAEFENKAQALRAAEDALAAAEDEWLALEEKREKLAQLSE